MGSSLVAYFSPGGNTRRLAQTIASVTGAELFEIRPDMRYTKADLDWMDQSSRSSLEMADAGARPGMAVPPPPLEGYETVYLGFPIWWYTAPRIINSFLESGDFSGKLIVPFATSGSSGYGNTGVSLKGSAPGARLAAGKVLKSGASAEEIRRWLSGIGL